MRLIEAVPELLARGGHEVVFGMLGGTNVPWVAAGVAASKIRLVKTRHEESAVQAAMGYSRVSGRLGVCTVVRAPGFANTIAGLIVARHAHVPVLLIVSESPSPGEWSDQSVPQEEICRAAAVGFTHVGRGEELQSAFAYAVECATWNGSPHVLSLADALFEEDIPLTEGREEATSTVPEPDPESIRAAVDLLAKAQRPLIVAGQGAVLAECRPELDRLADLVGARVATTIRATRFFEGRPHELGICGNWAPEPVRAVLAKSDVVLAVGASLNERTTGAGTIFGGAPVIQCEVDPERPFRASRPELGLLGDAKEVVAALIDEWTRRGLAAREVEGTSPSYADVRRAVRDVDLGHDGRRGLDPRDVYLALDRVLPPDRIVVTDSGRSLATSTALVNARDARSWVLGRGYGTVGLGIGTAVGAAEAGRGRPTVLFCGDGGLMMGIAALDVVRTQGLDLTIVVMNDEQLGAEMKHVRAHGVPADVIRQDLPDVSALAAAYDGVGRVIGSQKDLDALVLRGTGLEILDCRVDPEVDLPAAYT